MWESKMIPTTLQRRSAAGFAEKPESPVRGVVYCTLTAGTRASNFAKDFFERYGWTIVGKITSTYKKASGDEDVPFLKLFERCR